MALIIKKSICLVLLFFVIFVSADEGEAPVEPEAPPPEEGDEEPTEGGEEPAGDGEEALPPPGVGDGEEAAPPADDKKINVNLEIPEEGLQRLAQILHDLKSEGNLDQPARRMKAQDATRRIIDNAMRRIAQQAVQDTIKSTKF